MGTNAGLDLANLYLYAYESTFVDKLVKIHGVNAAKFFRYSFRLIDDVFSVDNCFAFLFMERANTSDVVLGGVYPGVLTLNETTVSRGICECRIQTGALLHSRSIADDFRQLDCSCISDPPVGEVLFFWVW